MNVQKSFFAVPGHHSSLAYYRHSRVDKGDTKRSQAVRVLLITLFLSKTPYLRGGVTGLASEKNTYKHKQRGNLIYCFSEKIIRIIALPVCLISEKNFILFSFIFSFMRYFNRVSHVTSTTTTTTVLPSTQSSYTHTTS